MTSLSGFAPFLGCLIIFKHLVKNPASKFFIENLTAFMPKQWDDKVKSTEDNKLSKKDKKVLQKKLTELKEAGDTVFCQRLNKKNVKELFALSGKAGDFLESIGILTVMLLLNAAAYVVCSPFLGAYNVTMLLIWTVICFGYVLYASLKVEFAGVDVSRSQLRWHCPLLFVFGALAAFGALVIAPDSGLVDFHINEAADSLGKGLTAFSKMIEDRRREKMSETLAKSGMMDAPTPTFVIEPLHLAFVLSVVAGLLTIILNSSAQRFARLAHLQTGSIPPWARGHMQQGLVMRVLYRAAFIAPVLLSLGYYIPLADFWSEFFAPGGAFGPIRDGLVNAIPVFPLDAAARVLTDSFSTVLSALLDLPGVWTAVLSLVVAALWLLCVRPLTQTHFSTSLLEWHSVQNCGVGKPQALHEIIVHRVSRVNLLSVKVCLQVLAPAVLLLALLVLGGLNDESMPAWQAATVVARAKLGFGNFGIIKGAAFPEMDASVLSLPAGEAFSAVLARLLANRDSSPVQLCQFCLFCAQFLTFWLCSVWSLFAGFWMAIYRMGMHLG